MLLAQNHQEPSSSAAESSRPKASKIFQEKELQAEIEGLIRKKEINVATKTLIDVLPGIYESKLNVKEKLNNLMFLTRLIQNAGGTKYGAEKLRTKFKSLAGYLNGLNPPQGGFIELGCGAHDPISLSTLFYLNGFTPSCGIDLLSPRTEVFSALSMYDTLANIKMFPGRYVWRSSKPSDILQRLRDIDTGAFERGDFRAGLESLGGQVRLISEDLLTCDLEPQSLALLTSFAVLEHVGDIDAIARRSYELLKPGGIAYHFVDLADHRSYRGDGVFGPHAFLAEETAPPNMNRLRAPEITAAQLRAGFELVKDERTVVNIPADVENRLLARFKAMDRQDVAATKQQLVLRRPL